MASSVEHRVLENLDSEKHGSRAQLLSLHHDFMLWSFPIPACSMPSLNTWMWVRSHSHHMGVALRVGVLTIVMV